MTKLYTLSDKGMIPLFGPVPTDKNTYFLPGQLIDPNLQKKPLKDDMAGSTQCWVDLDIAPNGKYNENRDALNDFLARIVVEQFVHIPTRVIDSGGGYQCFWKMKRFMLPPECEAINRTLAKIIDEHIPEDAGFTIDAVHNIDRVMRHHPSWNIPSEKKIKEKGYPNQPIETKEIYYKDHEYNPDEFLLAYDINLNEQVPIWDDVELQFDLQKDIDEDEIARKFTELPLHWGEYILNRKIPTKREYKPPTDDSESTYFFIALQQLFRHDFDQNEIMWMALSPDYKFSEYAKNKWHYQVVYERLSAQVTNAYNQIQKEEVEAEAKRKSAEDEVEALNAELAIVSTGGNVRFVRYSDKPKLNMYSNADITTLYAPRLEVFKKWKHSSIRKEYNEVAMVNPSNNPNVYSLWMGFDPPPRDCSKIVCEALDNFYATLIDDDEQREFFLNWIAWCVQNPGKHSGRFPYLVGKKGCGKTFMGILVMYLFGHFGSQVDMTRAFGQFNDLLQFKAIAFFDEIGKIKEYQAANIKRLINAPDITIETKGLKAYNVRNTINFIATIDNEENMYAEEGERRTVAININDNWTTRRGSNPNFEGFKKTLGIKGKEREMWTKLDEIIDYFQKRDISTFDINQKMVSDTQRAAAYDYLMPEEQILLNYARDGAWPDELSEIGFITAKDMEEWLGNDFRGAQKFAALMDRKYDCEHAKEPKKGVTRTRWNLYPAGLALKDHLEDIFKDMSLL